MALIMKFDHAVLLQVKTMMVECLLNIQLILLVLNITSNLNKTPNIIYRV